MTAVVMSEVQDRIWDNASVDYGYTYAEMVVLAKKFSADTTLQTPTPGSIVPEEVVMTEVNGLCEAGWFWPCVVEGGDATDLDDWRFTKNPTKPAVSSPDGPYSVSWVIPFTVQGQLKAGVTAGACPNDSDEDGYGDYGNPNA